MSENHKDVVRKFSTGEEASEEETFKNRTLRFTNNNFVGSNDRKQKDAS